MRFEGSKTEEPIDVTADQETQGLKSEEAVLALLNMSHDVFETIEPTPKNGINDKRHIDAFAHLRGNELPCAIDVSGAVGERRANKKKIDQLMPLIRRHDELTGRPISGLMPHFTLELTSLGFWGMITEKIRSGEEIDQKEKDKEEKSFLLQMLLQTLKMEKLPGFGFKGFDIRPYKMELAGRAIALANRSKGLFNRKEIDSLKTIV